CPEAVGGPLCDTGCWTRWAVASSKGVLFFTSPWNNPFFTVSSITLIQKSVVTATIKATHCRTVLAEYMSCNDTGKLILKHCLHIQ
uniref:Nuclear envelope phosphatase-regulatory subunit 1 n=1 Tax=Salvator merianae TaxID=96440 RepID=A0A8D0AZH6_SALMN